jgi:hypothetical protein
MSLSLPEFVEHDYIGKILVDMGLTINKDSNLIVPLTEIFLMVIGILLLNNYSHDNMLNPNNPEYAVFVTLIIFIIIICIFTYLIVSKIISENGYFSNAYLVFYGLLWLILLIPFQFILWIIKNTYTSIYETLMSGFNLFFGKDSTNAATGIFNNAEKQALLPKYAVLFLIITLGFVVMQFASADSNTLNSKSYIYALSVIIPLLLSIVMVYNFGPNEPNVAFTAFMIISIIAFFGVIFYFYSSLSLTTFTFMSYVINAIFLIIVLLALAMFFYIFSQYLKNFEGISGFIINFLFYIPCLLIDFFNYIRREFALTHNVIYIMFVVEVILILLYIYIPKLVNIIASNDGYALLKDSMFLDSQEILVNGPQQIQPASLSDEQLNKNQRYTFSMWVFLNEQPNNYSSYSNERTIFDYGNGKPKLTYYNNIASDKDKDKYIIYFTNNTAGIMKYEITLPSQKWNNIVFNYLSPKVDLYINGVLERSFNFANNMPTYNSSDLVIVGSNDGLDGAICNIRYYTTPLTSSQISNNYNLLMFQNPPTISLS